MQTSSYSCAFNIDPINRRFSQGGHELALEPKVFAVIVQLLTRAGELVTRNELVDAVWVTATSLLRP